jgi:hypothetical protein
VIVGPSSPRAEVEVFNLIQGFIKIYIQKHPVKLRGCGNFLLVASDAILAVWAVSIKYPLRRGCCRSWLDKDADGVRKPPPKSKGATTGEDESSIAQAGQDGTWNPVAFRICFGALDQSTGLVHLSKPLRGDKMIILP